jgi:MarR family transcriptional regulator, organic hydroperoxide resistance regulator
MSEPNPEYQEPFYQVKESWLRLKKLNQDLQHQANISLEEAIVLCCLFQHCKSQGHVADETGLTPSQASRLLSRLEYKSLIHRSIGHPDKRKMIFDLTPSGRKTLEMITPLVINQPEM